MRAICTKYTGTNSAVWAGGGFLGVRRKLIKARRRVMQKVTPKIAIFDPSSLHITHLKCDWTLKGAKFYVDEIKSTAKK